LLLSVAILGLAGAALAVLGRARWGDFGWYYHPTAEYRFRRAQQALRQNNKGRAEDIASWLDTQGQKDRAILLRGEILLLQGQSYARIGDSRAQVCLSGAVDKLSQIRDQGLLRREATILIGKCLLDLNRTSEAEQAFAFVLAEDADQVEAHRGLAAIYYDQGALGKAVTHLQRVAVLDPLDGRPHRLMGLIFKEMEQYPQALAAYQEALERDLHGQSPATTRKELAETLVKLTRPADALEVLGQFDPEPQDFTAVQTLRGECLWALGRHEEARAVLDHTLATQTPSGDLYRLRAKMHLEAGEPQAAATLLKRALALDRHDFASRYQLVLAYRQLGDATEAAEQQRLFDRSQKDFAELSRLNHEALKDPWDQAVRLDLAAVCDRLDKPKEAAMWRRAAHACAGR
jgi:tetratricopeptide (TPR) repeat protein